MKLTEFAGVSKLVCGERKGVKAIRDVGNAAATIIRRMFRGREILNSFPKKKVDQVLENLENLNSLIVKLRRKLGVSLDIPDFDRLHQEQGKLMLKIIMMSIFRNVNDLIEEAAAFEGDDSGAMRSEEEILILDSKKLIDTLTSHFDYEELMTPSKALQTLNQIKQQFGLSILHKMGFSGNSIPEELFDSKLRQIFRDFDSDASGAIESEELASAMAVLNIVVTHKELETLLRAADADGAGAINFAEFKSLVASVLSDNKIHITRRLRVHSTLIPAPDPASADLPIAPHAALRIHRRRSSVVRGGSSPDESESPTASSAHHHDYQPSPNRALAFHTPGHRRPSAHGKGLALWRRKSSLSPMSALAARRRSSTTVTLDDLPRPDTSPVTSRPSGYSHLRTGARALRQWMPATEI
jgi:hypothetical protein